MSLWLSEANRWTGAGRSFWMAEIQRQQTAMLSQIMEQTARFWSGAWMSGETAARSGSRRKPR
jgi:hypothetical protein